MATASSAGQKATKKEGDISDAFVSLSGAKRDPLPDRFRQLKCDLVHGRETAITESWVRLLRDLRKENEIIASKGSDVIPQVDFKNLEGGIADMKGEITKRGAVVVRDVVPEAEARAFKEEIEEYVKKNPWTRGMFRLFLLLYFPKKKKKKKKKSNCYNRLQRSQPTTRKYTSYTGPRRSSRPARTLTSSEYNNISCRHYGTCLPPRHKSLLQNRSHMPIGCESVSLATQPLLLGRTLTAAALRDGSQTATDVVVFTTRF
jgi:hypothetical protein